MNKIFSRLKKIQIKQIVTAFALGILLFVTQACSSVTAETPDSTYEGGINQYSDVDPQSKAAEDTANMKAKVLKDKATEENLEDLGEKIEYNLQDAADEAQDNTEDLAKETEGGIENIKDDTSDAVNELTNNVQPADEDAFLSTQGAVEDASNTVERTLQDVVD